VAFLASPTYFPTNFGSRFSMMALTSSRASAVVKNRSHGIGAVPQGVGI
jgi:hypothetical protein